MRLQYSSNERTTRCHKRDGSRSETKLRSRQFSLRTSNRSRRKRHEVDWKGILLFLIEALVVVAGELLGSGKDLTRSLPESVRIEYEALALNYR